MTVRRIIAAILLTCFGILLPTVASPLRICLLDDRLFLDNVGADSNCCSDCDRETEKQDSCCMDLESLPEALNPQPSLELPPMIVIDLPPEVTPAAMWGEPGHKLDTRLEPIRGPASPAAHRAVLGIWRL
jgi:hypothetical protein